MSTHHGFIKEFPFIRVDAFNGDPAELNPYTGRAPHFYLLTHAHTDHIGGLNSPHFHGQIYATPITKQLVLDTMEAADRVRFEELGSRIRRKRKFANLFKVKVAPRPSGSSSARPSGRGAGIDRIKEIPLNTRVELTGPDDVPVTVTALDANHCPGSCMFLIEGLVDGVQRAVLVTGDVRIEPWWLDALNHNPLVAPYLPSATGGEHRATKPLDCIYLDTSNVLLNEELLTKDEAVAAAVELMAQYPPYTRFFLNAWTWGYEELLKGVHTHFGEEIHLDWYKHRLYTSAPFRDADPLLATLGTTSSFPSACTSRAVTAPSPSLHAHPTSPPSAGPSRAPARPQPLRFHACERRWKCDLVWQDGLGCFAWDAQHVPSLRGPKKLKRPGSGETLPREEGGGARVVYVNPGEMPRWRWEAYEGEIVPLARHSSLPELQSLVALFRPQTLYPLTSTDDDPVSPAHQYISLPSLFGPLLAPGGEARLRLEAETYRRQVIAQRRRRGTRMVEPSEPTPSHGEDDDLVEPRWVTEMSKKGLNVEGGWDVLDEVVGWAQRLAKGERAPSASPKKKRRRSETPPRVDILELCDSEDDDGGDGRIALAAALARQLSYGASSPPRARARPSELHLSGVAPYPEGETPSPFLARRPPPPHPRDITPEDAVVPAAPTSRVPASSAALPVRKSVTFSSPSRRHGMAARWSTSTMSSAPGASRPLPPSPPTTTASSSSAPSSHRFRLLGAAPPAPPAKATLPSPAAPAPAPASSRPPRARPPLATRAARQAAIACLHRQLRGLIAPQGGAVVPFAAGDPRLQGKRALAPARVGLRVDAVKENVAAGPGGVGRGRAWDSPTSFRTVSATASP
ncbi:hypothetical protein DMC30DRAFT_445127 [Rhodotorula diobovata]|uniref:DNA repair metallo-beta-lactamase domain-containing protein n=1 Tax=Rhodotorula diobovata TaxID=5288 RepID=A0A5C5G0Q5_9BASI|nr:hypothetical protein DMC30DRAFT_445127 [Rhodotorula diobovata]